jgi:hypothetical protein
VLMFKIAERLKMRWLFTLEKEDKIEALPATAR